ncbi:Aste57867_14239 [Aphanomyces stellatus]|uniref:Aste57867_14239 protein n=1 Tax=Aphanomyces stellatus TaxID=120398 RepID=A0A485L050_9STRA|nr:hypothetical protein As57867_014188 [Aphanomyces stellatus]VFT91064.1 Aste57867_14239 [Aphanomyces stellatus]
MTADEATDSGAAILRRHYDEGIFARHSRYLDEYIAHVKLTKSTPPLCLGRDDSHKDDVTRAYASCGRTLDALYAQAILVECTPWTAPTYVDRVLVSAQLLVEAGQFIPASNCLLTVLNRLPPPLTRHDGVFLMAYAHARSGDHRRAALFWRQSFNDDDINASMWATYLQDPEVWNACGRKCAAAGLWTFARLVFAEGMPFVHSTAPLHAIPLPYPEPHGPTVALFIHSLLLGLGPPNFAVVDEVLVLAMRAPHVKYNATMRLLCSKWECRSEWRTAFAAEDDAAAVVGRWWRRSHLWRHARVRYWVDVAVRGFQTYTRPPKKTQRASSKALKRQPQSTKKSMRRVVASTRDPEDTGATAASTVAEMTPPPPPEPSSSSSLPPSSPDDDLVAMYGARAGADEDFESRLRFVLHRATTIAKQQQQPSSMPRTLESVMPEWLKQLHVVRGMVDETSYMTSWKASVMRNMEMAVRAMEAAHGSTSASRYIHALLKDIAHCHAQDMPRRLDRMLALATAEESKRNLAFYHVVATSKHG